MMEWTHWNLDGYCLKKEKTLNICLDEDCLTFKWNDGTFIQQ